MRWIEIRSPLPLLVKELVEQAVRRRTYIVRVVYALLLFSVFLTFAYEHTMSANVTSLMGQGRDMFRTLMAIQFGGILLFLPATMSSAIASEKERQSLALLFLTDLRSREILSQKFVSRLIPMFTFLLLGLPPLALCYAFGGITGSYLLSGFYLLVVACFQVGALSLACSTYCGTSLSALIASYLLTAVLYGFVGLIFGSMISPWLLFVRYGDGSLPETFSRSLPILASVVAFLVASRSYLWRRAFVPQRNVLLEVFRRVDRFFNDLNEGFGGILLVRDKATLPGDKPIAWREVSKRSLSKAAYLFRVLVLLEAPLVLTAVSISYEFVSRGNAGALSVLLYVVWIFAALAAAVSSANTLASERSNQTLDVLLTTPITGRDILVQKLRGVRRFACVMLVPLLSAFAFRVWVTCALYPGLWSSGVPITYIVVSVLSVGVYLPLVIWGATWVGLRTRTRSRAIIFVLVLLVTWTALPPLVARLGEAALPGVVWDKGVPRVGPGSGMLAAAYFASPASVVYAIERAGVREFNGLAPLGWIAANFVFHGALLLFLRAACLRRADGCLGRAEGIGGEPKGIE